MKTNEPKIAYWIRAENCVTEQISEDFGPFRDYIELTYNCIRVGPDGSFEFATMDSDGYWILHKSMDPQQRKWSDIVMWATAKITDQPVK